MESAFGVDHGEISTTTVSKFASTLVAGGAGGVAGSKRAKKKYKSQAATSGMLRTAGGELAGQTVGGLAGLAAARGRPTGILAGGAAGSVGGGVLGNASARGKAKREGWTK